MVGDIPAGGNRSGPSLVQRKQVRLLGQAPTGEPSRRSSHGAWAPVIQRYDIASVYKGFQKYARELTEKAEGATPPQLILQDAQIIHDALNDRVKFAHLVIHFTLVVRMEGL